VAGLNLNVGGYGTAGSARLPYAANNPSSTISQKAFGITTGVAAGSKVPAYGSLTLGIVGTAILVWLWYSLPR
jgi:hypothetical protein